MTSFEVLDLLSGRNFHLLGKDFVGEVSCYDLNIRLRHGFVMFSVSLGRDLSDWSRPPFWSLNNKVFATSISLIGTSLGSASSFLSRPRY